MRKQQDAANNELEVKQTPTHIVYEVTTCKTCGDNYNSLNIKIKHTLILSNTRELNGVSNTG